jgi:hypothetical protein
MIIVGRRFLSMNGDDGFLGKAGDNKPKVDN